MHVVGGQVGERTAPVILVLDRIILDLPGGELG